MKRICALLVLFCVTTAESCNDTQPISNWSFDRWQDGKLLDWSLDAGSVVAAPTWDKYDTGISLVGQDVQISQVVKDHDCYAFEIEANIAPDAQVTFAFDEGNTGVESRAYTLPSAGWTVLHYNVNVTYTPWRLVLRKSGAGEAVIAQIRAPSSTNCTADDVLPVFNQPVGHYCVSADQCAGGICAGDGECLSEQCRAGVCSTCDADGFCPAGGAPAGAGCAGDYDCKSGSCRNSDGAHLCFAHPAPCHTDADCGVVNGVQDICTGDLANGICQ